MEVICGFFEVWLKKKKKKFASGVNIALLQVIVVEPDMF